MRINKKAGVLTFSAYLATSGQLMTHTPSVLSGQLESCGACPRELDFAVAD